MAAMAAQLNTLPWIYPNIVYRIIPWIWKGSDYFITRPVKFFFVFFFRQKESLGALTCWAVHHSPPSVAVACQSLSIREWFLGVLIKWRVFDVLNWRSPSLIRLDHSRCPSRWLGSVAKTWPLLFSCGTLPPWPVTCLEVVLFALWWNVKTPPSHEFGSPAESVYRSMPSCSHRGRDYV